MDYAQLIANWDQNEDKQKKINETCKNYIKDYFEQNLIYASKQGKNIFGFQMSELLTKVNSILDKDEKITWYDLYYYVRQLTYNMQMQSVKDNVNIYLSRISEERFVLQFTQSV